MARLQPTRPDVRQYSPTATAWQISLDSRSHSRRRFRHHSSRTIFTPSPSAVSTSMWPTTMAGNTTSAQTMAVDSRIRRWINLWRYFWCPLLMPPGGRQSASQALARPWCAAYGPWNRHLCVQLLVYFLSRSTLRRAVPINTTQQG